MTESFAMISCRDLRDLFIIGNVGYSLSDQQIRINPLGEIELKGSQIFDGYTQLSGEPTPPYPFTEDGWFKTGDFGKLESDGSLSVLSRRTDLIVSGGKNIIPQEVESELATLPYVQEVAVTGIPDEEWGEIVVALVRLAPALSEKYSLVDSSEFSISNDLVSVTESELTQQIREDATIVLERYQLPKRVLIVDELPRTELGKLKRAELKEWAKRRILPS
jgi:acyl-CoA synthetase (AMP-forming)/AMP-acid ligase II